MCDNLKFGFNVLRKVAVYIDCLSCQIMQCSILFLQFFYMLLITFYWLNIVDSWVNPVISKNVVWCLILLKYREVAIFLYWANLVFAPCFLGATCIQIRIGRGSAPYRCFQHRQKVGWGWLYAPVHYSPRHRQILHAQVFGGVRCDYCRIGIAQADVAVGGLCQWPRWWNRR